MRGSDDDNSDIGSDGIAEHALYDIACDIRFARPRWRCNHRTMMCREAMMGGFRDVGLRWRQLWCVLTHDTSPRSSLVIVC